MDDKLISALHRNVKPGEMLTFGTYPQMADGLDKTPIQWLVLENSGSALFVLSKYILDCKRYHGEFTDIIWRDCDLRQWLNDEFYNAAFTDAEKAGIKTTHNTGNGEGSPDTDDKVFLLSDTEVNSLADKLGKDVLRARGTEFAKTKKVDGCRLGVYDKSVNDNYIIENDKKYGCSWWWLRTQGRLKDTGNDPSRALFIGTRASIRHYGRVNLPYYGVRPALMLHLPTG